MIRPVNSNDASAVAHIYNHYISNTVVTFEEEPVTSAEMRNRILATSQDELPWFVAEQNDELVGYAYASKWKGRCAYRFAVEVTVYLATDMQSKGWGTKLYQQLFNELKSKSIHTVIGGIALPNPASIALHEKFGMQKVAHFREVGFKFDGWVDVGYWQGMLADCCEQQ